MTSGRAMPCRQCGEWTPVTVLRRRGRRVRYWCRRCEAVVTTATAAGLAPVAEPPTPPPGNDGVDALHQVMPVAMVRWLRSRPGRPITLDRLDKAAIYQLYRRWDAQRQPDEADRLPAFSVVVGALHDACYDGEPAVAALLPPGSSPEQRAALAERAAHALRWLAYHRATQCWVIRLSPPDGPARPDRQLVEAAITALRAGAPLDPSTSAAVRAATFGTTSGPTLARLMRVYSAGELIAALERYLKDGARPLRDEVVARIEAAGS